MGNWVEVWTGGERRLLALDADRATVGAAGENDICIDGDATVSRLHAVLERMGEFWTIRDLGSRNGVFVNGERLARDRVLRAGDEVLLGRTKVILKADPTSARP